MYLKPICTSIKKSIEFNKGHLVLEDYHQFAGRQNLYFVKDSAIEWFAELPTSFNYDAYVDFELINNTITA